MSHVIYLAVDSSVGDIGIGNSCPISWKDDVELDGGFEVGLVEARDESMC